MKFLMAWFHLIAFFLCPPQASEITRLVTSRVDTWVLCSMPGHPPGADIWCPGPWPDLQPLEEDHAVQQLPQRELGPQHEVWGLRSPEVLMRWSTAGKVSSLSVHLLLRDLGKAKKFSGWSFIMVMFPQPNVFQSTQSSESIAPTELSNNEIRKSCIMSLAVLVFVEVIWKILRMRFMFWWSHFIMVVFPQPPVCGWGLLSPHTGTWWRHVSTRTRDTGASHNRRPAPSQSRLGACWRTTHVTTRAHARSETSGHWSPSSWRTVWSVSSQQRTSDMRIK